MQEADGERGIACKSRAANIASPATFSKLREEDEKREPQRLLLSGALHDEQHMFTSEVHFKASLPLISSRIITAEAT